MIHYNWRPTWLSGPNLGQQRQLPGSGSSRPTAVPPSRAGVPSRRGTTPRQRRVIQRLPIPGQPAPRQERVVIRRDQPRTPPPPPPPGPVVTREHRATAQPQDGALIILDQRWDALQVARAQTIDFKKPGAAMAPEFKKWIADWLLTASTWLAAMGDHYADVTFDGKTLKVGEAYLGDTPWGLFVHPITEQPMALYYSVTNRIAMIKGYTPRGTLHETRIPRLSVQLVLQTEGKTADALRLVGGATCDSAKPEVAQAVEAVLAGRMAPGVATLTQIQTAAARTCTDAGTQLPQPPPHDEYLPPEPSDDEPVVVEPPDDEPAPGPPTDTAPPVPGPPTEPAPMPLPPPPVYTPGPGPGPAPSPPASTPPGAKQLYVPAGSIYTLDPKTGAYRIAVPKGQVEAVEFKGTHVEVAPAAPAPPAAVDPQRPAAAVTPQEYEKATRPWYLAPVTWVLAGLGVVAIGGSAWYLRRRRA